jgi:hypothetical protein
VKFTFIIIIIIIIIIGDLVLVQTTLDVVVEAVMLAAVTV